MGTVRQSSFVYLFICVFTAKSQPKQRHKGDIRVVLTPRKWWQRMRSGCAADAQRSWMRSVTTPVVEAKKDRCANDGAPKLPQNPADAPPPPRCEKSA
jgi:hypothetical protein